MSEPVHVLSFLVFYQENTPVQQGFVENWSRLWQWEQMKSSIFAWWNIYSLTNRWQNIIHFFFFLIFFCPVLNAGFLLAPCFLFLNVLFFPLIQLSRSISHFNCLAPWKNRICCNFQDIWKGKKKRVYTVHISHFNFISY